jgi:tRNA-Thr(GGU) m(6)t(6)A37 methyltransferase TsaA
MVRRNELRAGETAIEAPAPDDARLVFIGRIHTPWQDRLTCPRQGRQDGPTCRIEVFEPWVAALDGITEYQHIEVLYWLHLSRRDIVRQSPRNDGVARGAFSLRTPVRPNPIGTQLVALLRVDGGNVFVRGLDCLDGTPLIDLKPDRCAFTPLAPRQAGDDQVGDG